MGIAALEDEAEADTVLPVLRDPALTESLYDTRGTRGPRGRVVRSHVFRGSELFVGEIRVRDVNLSDTLRMCWRFVRISLQ